MGRHRAPLPEGTALPRAPIAISAAALLVVLALLIGVFVATRGGGDDNVTTNPNPSTTPSSAAASSKAKPTEPAPATTAGESETEDSSGKRPPTLTLKLSGSSFVTVRLPNGRTVVSKLFHKGDRKTFDQKELRVLLGNSSAVQVTVNGKPRKSGRKGQVDTFTVRRK